MSKQIEERVVSMQFDNKRFEQNVQTSMSTLDKLKHKLNLTGASKGLENVQTAAKRVDMSGLSNSVETVRSRFSALEVMGVTALANITNSAVNAGKKMISALTIDPITTGFQEYETQMNAVQTILANTQSKGSTLDDVNKALDTLNTYADKTIYNFTEMTRNIGTFTAAGVDLQTSVDSIQGIANLAAVSGSSSQQASTAMYQLSQALAAGRVSLMDWNSVVNAGMGGELFQNALLRTSELLKTGGKEAVKTYGSFRESLTKGQWLTTEVLTETLKQISGAYSEADLIAQGFTKEQAKEIASLAETATNAATKVKTFSQLWDVMKESAQSGWAQTWKLIIGDFEQAKALLTPLADFFTGVIGKMSDARNKLLESALGKSFTSLGEKIKGALKPMEGTAKAIGKAADSVKDYGKIVDEIIDDKWGKGQARWDKLTEAGYDWAHAQNLVNEKLGDSTRHATKYKEAQDGATKSTEKSAEASGNLTKAQAKTLEHLIALSDAELKAKGYTDEQIKAFRELEDISKKLGIPIRELVTNLDQINGRWLMINSFKNIGQSIVKIFKAIGEAWRDAFPPMTSDQLFNIIAGFHKLSTKLKMSDGTAESLTRTLKGVFAILDIILTIVGGPIKIAFKILTQLLGAFDMNILDLTAIIGDAIVKFRNWIDKTLDFTKVFEKIAPYIKKATTAIKEWIDKTQPLEKVASFFNKVGAAVKDFAIAFKNSQFFETGVNIVKGLVNGIKNGISGLWNIITSIATGLIDKVKSILGIHSPSLVFMAIGGFIVSGLILGIQNGAPQVWEVIKGLGTKCVEVLKNIDFGKLIAAAVGVGLLFGVGKIINILDKLASPFEGIGDLLSGIGDGIEANLKAKALEHKSEALFNLAKSIAILVASVYVLTKLDTGKLWSSIGALAALAAIVVALALVAGKMEKIEKFKFPSGTILGIAVALLAMSIVLKKLASIDSEDGWRAMAMLAVLLTGLIGIMVAIGKFVKGKTATNIDKVGKMLKKLSIALLLMVIAVKLCAKLSVDDVIKGSLAITAFAGIVVGLTAASRLAGKRLDAAGNMILKTSAAMLLMAVVVKIMAKMNVADIIKGTLCVAAFAGIVVGLMAATKLMGPNTNKIGSSIMGIAGAMLIMSIVVMILSRLDPGDLAKGIITIALFGGIIAGLIAATHLAGENAIKAGLSLVLISACIAVLTAVVVALSSISLGGLIKGITITALLGVLMVGLIYATKDAEACKGNIITMSIAIALLAVSVALLSRIDGSKLAGATLAMTILMGMFAIVMKSANNINSSIGPLIVMTIAVALFGGIIAMLAKFEVANVLGAALGLSALLLAITASLLIVSKVGKFAKDALIGVLALTTMAVPLLAFVSVLALMQNIQNATANVYALTVLATAMTLLLIPLTIIGAFGMAGLPFIGVLALTAMAVPLLAFVGVLALMQNIQNATANANLLITLVTTMTKVLVVLSIVGPLALIGVTALTAMSGLMVGLGVLAVAIGALMEKFPSLQSFLDKGIPVLVQLAGGIGKMIGAFVGGVMTEIANTLPAIGTCLSQFMNNAMVFIMGAKMVDETVLAGVGILAGAIIALTAADLITGVMSFLQGGSSFADLGTQLSQFMMNALPFIATARMIDPDIMTGVKTLAEAILVLTGANMLESITRFLGGESSLANFGSQLGGLGTSMRTFVTNLGTFTEDQVTTVNCAGKAIKALADAASTIPNEGGIWAAIVGDNSLATFGSKLPKLGTDLSGFINNLGTFTGDQVTTVNCAGKAIKALAEAASEIPNEGGLWATIVGDNSLATFGSKLPALGTNLKGFITNLGTFGDDSIATVNCAGKAIKALADAASKIPNEGGFWAKIVGDNSLATFGSKLPDLAKNIASFVKNLGTFGEGQIATVNSACKAIKAIAQLGKIDLGDTSSGIEKLGKKLGTFATKLADFISKMNEIGGENISSAIQKTKDLISLAQTAASANVESLSTFGKSLKSIAKDGVKGFVDELSKKSYKADAKKAAEAIVKAFIEKMGNLEDDVKNKGKTVAGKASDGLSEAKLKSKGETAGKDLGKGLVKGIEAKYDAAYDAGYKLGQKAVQGEKDGQKSKSPSKLTMQAGKWFGEGLVIGIERMTSAVYKSAHGLGETATGTISTAVSKIADIVNSDIDAQPTIRPVLDLSNVRSGAGSINALFSGRTLAVDIAGVGAVSASMAGYQNGNGSREIVSSIKALRKDIADMPRNTYTVNGVTYDDGSNISNAVSSLIRQIKIDRRT